jgi:hypothetical protein
LKDADVFVMLAVFGMMANEWVLAKRNCSIILSVKIGYTNKYVILDNFCQMALQSWETALVLPNRQNRPSKELSCPSFSSLLCPSLARFCPAL